MKEVKFEETSLGVRHAQREKEKDAALNRNILDTYYIGEICSILIPCVICGFLYYNHFSFFVELNFWLRLVLLALCLMGMGFIFSICEMLGIRWNDLFRIKTYAKYFPRDSKELSDEHDLEFLTHQMNKLSLKLSNGTDFDIFYEEALKEDPDIGLLRSIYDKVSKEAKDLDCLEKQKEVQRLYEEYLAKYPELKNLLYLNSDTVEPNISSKIEGLLDIRLEMPENYMLEMQNVLNEWLSRQKHSRDDIGSWYWVVFPLGIILTFIVPCLLFSTNIWLAAFLVPVLQVLFGYLFILGIILPLADDSDYIAPPKEYIFEANHSHYDKQKKHFVLNEDLDEDVLYKMYSSLCAEDQKNVDIKIYHEGIACFRKCMWDLDWLNVSGSVDLNFVKDSISSEARGLQTYLDNNDPGMFNTNVSDWAEKINSFVRLCKESYGYIDMSDATGVFKILMGI